MQSVHFLLAAVKNLYCEFSNGITIPHNGMEREKVLFDLETIQKENRNNKRQSHISSRQPIYSQMTYWLVWHYIRIQIADF